MNVVSYAQIAFKVVFSRLDQPMHMQSLNVLIQGMCIGWFLWEIWLFLLEGETIPPFCALPFLPFISIEVNSLCISSLCFK